ncbi:NADH-quinone oxidoreductase subunit M [Serinibacter arcticus]|uniref:NADH-quinone oxidoreductase subunit M n=1 Tax=Serinibacter arcticus TaxID=1655435 RepID=A0A2U1ZU73_9MICO|nr:NADH-quinone oxidoreductase subunit M [Serinibacter arcticus]PWD50534.1 NADH-quinone oxidoreductase subunit M [Serinibacter arcticus]
MTSLPWITILIAVPLVAALVLWLVPALHPRARTYGLVVSLLTVGIAVAMATTFDLSAAAEQQLTQQVPWIPAIGVSYAVGLNGLGLVMVLLAVALVPVVLAADWHAVPVDAEGGDRRRATFVALVLVLTSLMVAVFAARDVFLFYVLFEVMLIPVYFLVGMFGGPNRRSAAVKFLVYSLAGGLVMLVGVVVLYLHGPGGETGFLIDNLAGVVSDETTQRWLFVAFFVAFAVKAPMWPVHTWLPDTTAQATPGTSTLLVGVLDKVGTFGMLALCLPLFPEASRWAAPAIVVLALISIIYGALVAMGQQDMMRFIAFTSISHFGFIVMGVFIGSEVAMTGAMFYMLAHGLSIAGLFLLAGYLAERGGSRRIDAFGGMQRLTPVLAGLFLIAGMASVALPGLSGFVGEYLVLVGSFTTSIPAAAVATLGVVLAALYFLLVYQRVFTGEPRAALAEAKADGSLRDLGARERWTMVPVVVAMVVLGVLPGPVLDLLTPLAEVLALGGAQ